MRVTLFDHVRNPLGRPLEVTWADFKSSFMSPTREASRKDSLPGWSAASFVGNHRIAGNVYEVSAVVLDYDKGTTTMKDAQHHWANHIGLMHTTFSHTPERPRYRVVLPSSRPMNHLEYEVVWDWAYKYALSEGHEIDVQTKDAGRFWFAPCKRADYIYRIMFGRPLDVDKILDEHDYVPDTVFSEPTRLLSDTELPGALLRAAAYLQAMEGAVSGQGGHTQTLLAATCLVRGFCLPPDLALQMLEIVHNSKCEPPWSTRELKHKIKQAMKYQGKPAGYLLGK